MSGPIPAVASPAPTAPTASASSSEVHGRVLPMGDTALLLEVSDIGEVLALETRLATLVRRGEGVWASVDDLVPAARTVLLVSRPGVDLGALGTAVRDVARTLDAGKRALDRDKGTVDADQRTVDADQRTVDADQRTVEIHVRYDGPDLDEVAHLVGLTPGQVVAAHTGTSWQVGFGGFAPGFAYLVGGDPRLEVPRRAEPRTRVPAGAVGLAGQFSGIYPRESPGGWQLLGTTDAPLWDADREPPALLTPGTTVQFVDAEARS